jgi:hypothetical protein
VTRSNLVVYSRLVIIIIAEIRQFEGLVHEKVEARFGKPIRYAKDCDVLAVSIHAFTIEKISCSTVKRLFGLIESDNEPRLYTLDIIAEYLGYLNYDHLIQDFNPNKSSLNETLETISASDLKKGVTCQYSPAGEVL